MPTFTSLSLPGFRWVYCCRLKTLSTFFCSIQSIVKDNTFSKKNIFSFNSLLVSVIILIRPLIKSRDITKEFVVWKLQIVVAFSVSEGTNFEVDTISIILSYLYHVGNVKQKLFTVNLQHAKPCKQNVMWNLDYAAITKFLKECFRPNACSK